MPNLKYSLLLIPAFMLLTACPSASDCAPDDGRDLADATAKTGNCAETSAPANISISFPATDSITHLTDAAGTKTGIYSYAGSVTVTDTNGNAVADDTIVQLDVIDTILAKGTIETSNSDSISATNLVDTNPTLLSDDFGIAAADFTTVNVKVNGASVGIDTNSLILITNGADKQDQQRKISSVTGNTATATSSYNGTYPNATYPTGTTSYVIGKTTVGMDILGIDPDDGSKLVGYSKTKDGKASFRLEYPANADTIHIGCIDSDTVTDTRYTTKYSRDVVVVAQVNGSPALTVVDDSPCFASILPQVFTANKIKTANDTTVTLTLKDAESIPLPFETVAASPAEVLDPPVIPAAGDICTTNIYGKCDVKVYGDKTDTITYNTPTAGGTAVTITIQ